MRIDMVLEVNELGQLILEVDDNFYVVDNPETRDFLECVIRDVVSE